jgi:alkanesulfonate monooxygenase SsuD/methylene tetrahydromethanopterin reductase-like flavin-dependent oxidoreductase (luciferase family)
MEFAIAIPQTDPNPAHIQRFLQRAEDLPFTAAWCIEQVIGTAPVLESVTTLAYAAGLTKRLRLGIAALLIAQRNPIDLAKSLLARRAFKRQAHRWSGTWREHPPLSPRTDSHRRGRVSRFRENLDIIKRLWAEDRVTLHGRFSASRCQAIDRSGNAGHRTGRSLRRGALAI